ncbi:thiamine pyrophosphate-binding protein [Sphingobium phenoxybenzoativorans]|uniref:Thiamine pyrophosphate-binding protein n=1 Tax=Sphingobium phenoxybenzoativorans TaxID=1592790 RepID=A0A975K8X0_9SPHN|nr:thiamine pyrophosphate-binding protein [Sphingobium phenoxybenzoativorans]QUT06981.1 thiamine pyrophosphate-binding protein [Sphingobium phenoxybenzoativorans]
MYSGDQYLADAFAACGVSHFFHVPLVLPKAVKAMQAAKVNPIVVHSEKAAAYMADGYARASGRIGICGAQQIGAANLAAGLLDAYMARSPVLALTGGSSATTRDRNQYQEVDQQPIYAGLTKMTSRIDMASRLPDMLGQAMRVATTGAPGPVHLELAGFTGFVLSEPMDAAPLPDPAFALCPAVRHAAPLADIQRALDLLHKAERPVIIAGSGIRSSGAQDALKKFVRRHNLPLATSLDAKATLAESDPLSIGICGIYSREIANQAVSEADLVIFAGTTTGSMTTTGWKVPAPGVAAIQIDVDPRELGRNYPLQASLCGDPATIFEQLSEAAGEQPDRSGWLDHISTLRKDWRRAIEAVETSNALPVRPERLCRILSEELPERALLVVDTGHAAAWAARNIYLDRAGQGLLRAAGSLGWSYPAALGAKCAQPNRPVVCLTGDGAFLYHMSEMETARRYGINTVTIVSNNNGFSQEKPIWIDNPDYDHHWRFSPVNYAEAAQAFGCKAYRVERPEDLAPILRSVFRDDAPVIIEVMTDELVLHPPAWTPSEQARFY